MFLSVLLFMLRLLLLPKFYFSYNQERSELGKYLSSGNQSLALGVRKGKISVEKDISIRVLLYLHQLQHLDWNLVQLVVSQLRTQFPVKQFKLFLFQSTNSLRDLNLGEAGLGVLVLVRKYQVRCRKCIQNTFTIHPSTFKVQAFKNKYINYRPELNYINSFSYKVNGILKQSVQSCLLMNQISCRNPTFTLDIQYLICRVFLFQS